MTHESLSYAKSNNVPERSLGGQRSSRGGSAVPPVLLDDGRDSLLVPRLSWPRLFVFLVQLCRLAVCRTVGIWFVQQRLERQGRSSMTKQQQLNMMEVSLNVCMDHRHYG